jgi:hypothetical protein
VKTFVGFITTLRLERDDFSSNRHHAPTLLGA